LIARRDKLLEPAPVQAPLLRLVVLSRAEVGAALVFGLVLLDRDAMRVGPGLLADAGHLPGDLHPWLAASDREAIAVDLLKVVVRATNTCVQDSFFGIDGRGKRQVFTATFTFQIVDGLIHETWRNTDDLGRLFQLGARIVPGTTEA
jgi:hypothetical protein